MYSILRWGYGQVKGVCSVCVVLCLGSVHELLKWWTCHLQSYIIMYLEAAECELWWLYICTWSFTEELYWRDTYTGSHTWKQLNVNCGGYIHQ